MASKTKVEVMHELVGLVHSAGMIEEIDPVVEALLLRERKGSTGLESGIAVPHCKVETIPGLVLGMGIAPGGIDFDSLDGAPSKLFFLLLAPPDQSGPHIEALAEIAKLTQSEAFCNSLVSSADAAEVVELLTE